MRGATHHATRRPRPARPTALVGLLGFLSMAGCVPKGEHETVVSQLEQERVQREALEKKSDALAKRHAAAEAKLAELEERLAEAEYRAEVATRQRAEAEAIVEQLRGELSRLGSHIQHYAKRSQELESVHDRLAALEQDVAHRLSMFEHLSEELDDLDPQSGVSLLTLDGYPAVRFAAGSAVSRRGLNREAKRAIQTLATLATDSSRSEIVVLHAAQNESGRSVAIAIADAIKSRAPDAAVEALVGDGIDPGIAVALIRRPSPRDETRPTGQPVRGTEAEPGAL